MKPCVLVLGVSIALLAGCASNDRSSSDAPSADEGALRTSSTNDLTSAQEQEVLDQIDGACGDAWCEGDYDYRFIHFQCEFAKKRCTLIAKTADTTKRPKKWSKAETCTVKDVTRYEDVIETAANGFKSLADWQKIDDCVSGLK